MGRLVSPFEMDGVVGCRPGTVLGGGLLRRRPNVVPWFVARAATEWL